MAEPPSGLTEYGQNPTAPAAEASAGTWPPRDARETQMTKILDKIEIGYGYWTISTRPRWWPLMPGPLHEDNEHFEFPALHRHVHPAYLTDREYEAAEGNGCYPNDVWMAPLCRWADPRSGKDLERIMADKSGTLIENNKREDLAIVLAHCIRTVRRKRRRPMPPHPLSPKGGLHTRPRGFRTLFAAYCRKGQPPAAPNGICPHRGADLRSFAPEADGTIICPQHGLPCRIT